MNKPIQMNTWKIYNILEFLKHFHMYIWLFSMNLRYPIKNLDYFTKTTPTPSYFGWC